MSRFTGSRNAFCGLLSALGGTLAFLCFTAPALGDVKGDANAVTLLIGRGVDTNFAELLVEPWTADFVDLTVIGAAISTRLGTINELTDSTDLGSIGDDFSIDLETGAAYRFGDEDMGEVWGAVYLRFDGFPWNDTIYTTIAANTGLSYITRTSEFERSRDKEGQTSQLLHYLGPEVTFADPDNKNLELVLRYHHRSGIFRLIDDVAAGSTFISAGIRVRF
jgi:hypothetical protein